MKFILCSFLGIFFLCSCSKEKHSDPVLREFKHIIHLAPVDSINLEELGILSPERILYKKDHLILKNRQSPFLVSIYNIKDKTVLHTVPVGQGPNEATAITLLKTYKNNSISFRNWGTQTIQELQIDPYSGQIKTIVDLPSESRVLNLFETKDYYIGSGVLAEKRFIRIHKQDDEYSYEIDFPDNELVAGLNQLQKSVVFNAIRLEPKPDGKKFVTFMDGLMDIYDIKDTGFELTHSKEYFYPKFKISSEQFGAPATFSRDAIMGYYSGTADNNYIYILYSTYTYAENMAEGNGCKYLLIYDWEGNPIKAYQLEKPIGDITIDNDGNFYSLGFNPEAIVYKYNMNNEE